MRKETLIIHTDTWEILKGLPKEQLGTLFTALMKFQRDEDLPKMDGVTKMAFDFMAAQVTRDNEKYMQTVERRRAAGKAGAAARWQTHSNAYEGMRKDAIHSHTDTDTDTDTDTVTERYVSLGSLSPETEAELRDKYGDRADALMEDVRQYYTAHSDKRFPGWKSAMAQFDRNQKRWGRSDVNARGEKSIEEIAAEVFKGMED